jgi:hypothetical protein
MARFPANIVHRNAAHASAIVFGRLVLEGNGKRCIGGE